MLKLDSIFGCWVHLTVGSRLPLANNFVRIFHGAALKRALIRGFILLFFSDHVEVVLAALLTS